MCYSNLSVMEHLVKRRWSGMGRNKLKNLVRRALKPFPFVKRAGMRAWHRIGYMLSDAAVRAGNDLMLATTQPLAGALDPSSATLVNALRQAAKNILYTVGNSGYYRDFTADEEETDTVETTDVPAAGSSMNNMDRIFTTVNTLSIVLCAALMILVWLRWFLKKQKK